MDEELSAENVPKYLKPAFAGLLIDWSIGSREITATIVDLTMRDVIFIANRRIFRMKAGQIGELSDFEKKFVDLLFAERESMTFEELSSIAYKDKFDELLRIIAQGAKDADIIPQDIEAQLASKIKAVLPIGYSVQPLQTKGAVVLPAWTWPLAKTFLRLYKIGAVAAAVIFICTQILAIFQPKSWITAVLSFFSIFLLLTVGVFALPALLIYMIELFGMLVTKSLKQAGGSPDAWDICLSEKGKQCKKAAAGLKAFLEKFPVEDRLGTEFVAFLVAFGVKRELLKKALGSKNAAWEDMLESFYGQEATSMRMLDMQKYLGQL